MHIPDQPALLLAGWSMPYQQLPGTHPARRRNKAFTQFFLEKIAGVQRAEPSGAVRAGRRPGEGGGCRAAPCRCPRRTPPRRGVPAAKARVQGSALPLSAQDAAPARGMSRRSRTIPLNEQPHGFDAGADCSVRVVYDRIVKPQPFALLVGDGQ